MSSGVLLFAHNNREIDYGKIALANAMLVKKNLDVPVSIVTDDGTIDWLRKTHEPEKVFDKVIQIQRQNIENHKPYSDTRHTKKTLGFYNLNRVDAFELSPYDKTLILDVDYLVCNDLLKNCFTSNQPLMINRESRDLLSDRHIRAFDRVEEFGIDFYWATVFYFEKNTVRAHLRNYTNQYGNKYFHLFGKGSKNDNSLELHSIGVAERDYNDGGVFKIYFENDMLICDRLPFRLLKDDKESKNKMGTPRRKENIFYVTLKKTG